MSDRVEEVCLQERPTYKSFNSTQQVRGKKVMGKKQGLDLGVLYRVRDVCIWINKEQGSCLGINEEHKGCEAIKGSGRCGLYDSVIELVKSIHAPSPPRLLRDQAVHIQIASPCRPVILFDAILSNAFPTVIIPSALLTLANFF